MNGQPLAVVLEYLLVQVSSISCNVRCRFDSRIACMKNPDTVIVSEWWTGGEGTPRSVPRSKKWEGETTAETNASTLMRLTSHVTISPKIHCKQTKT